MTTTPKTEIKKSTCVICGRRFTPRRGGRPQITCSPECRKKRRRETIAEWVATHECPESKHGTLYGYSTMSCDCNECYEFYSNYRRTKRLEKKAGESNGQD